MKADRTPATDAGARRYAEKHGLPQEQAEFLSEFLAREESAAVPSLQIPKKLSYTVFPIVALREHSTGIAASPKTQGTAAILTRDGLFITAAHCVNVAFGERGLTGINVHSPSDYSIIAYELTHRTFKVCQVLELSISADYDVAFGRAETPNSDGFPYTLGVGTSRLGVGSAVTGIGFPETVTRGEEDGVLQVSFESRCFRGKVEEWRPDLVPWNGARSPGYRHSVRTPPGISGGPLIRDRTDLIHGILCGGFAMFDGPYMALDAKAFVDTWEVPMLGMTLRDYSRQQPDLLIR